VQVCSTKDHAIVGTKIHFVKRKYINNSSKFPQTNCNILHFPLLLKVYENTFTKLSKASHNHIVQEDRTPILKT